MVSLRTAYTHTHTHTVNWMLGLCLSMQWDSDCTSALCSLCAFASVSFFTDFIPDCSFFFALSVSGATKWIKVIDWSLRQGRALTTSSSLLLLTICCAESTCLHRGAPVSHAWRTWHEWKQRMKTKDWIQWSCHYNPQEVTMLEMGRCHHTVLSKVKKWYR